MQCGVENAVTVPGVVDRSEGEAGHAMFLQQLGKKTLHLGLVIRAAELQLHRNFFQLCLYIHLVLKLPL